MLSSAKPFVARLAVMATSEQLALLQDIRNAAIAAAVALVAVPAVAAFAAGASVIALVAATGLAAVSAVAATYAMLTVIDRLDQTTLQVRSETKIPFLLDPSIGLGLPPNLAPLLEPPASSKFPVNSVTGGSRPEDAGDVRGNFSNSGVGGFGGGLGVGFGGSHGGDGRSGDGENGGDHGGRSEDGGDESEGVEEEGGGGDHVIVTDPFVITAPAPAHGEDQPRVESPNN